MMKDSVKGDRTSRRIAVASLILVCLTGVLAVLGFNKGPEGANFSTKSWDSYIDNLIGHSNGACDKAAIIGLESSLWTTKHHPDAFVLVGTEAQTVARALKNMDMTTFQSSGIWLGGVKYQFLRKVDNTVLEKKKRQGRSHAAEVKKSNCHRPHSRRKRSGGHWQSR